MNNNYELVLGLEIHIQLKTKSKMFDGAPNETWQVEPNSTNGPVDIGLPGTLPVPNKEAIKMTQRLGHALHCTLNANSKFDRKNYFYPDLPKGYQISQYDQPFCKEGYLDIPTDDGSKRIQIRRIHLEEDTGKSMHKNGKTYLDFNKSGVPLVELVTEPNFTTSDEASTFGKIIQEIARILDISDTDMEKGHMRLEANVSVRKKGESELPPYRIELKNINSFKFMRDAVNYEIDRQIKAIEAGETLSQETRGWNEDTGKSFLQRRKEDAHDYRYFPEPDIPPLTFDSQYFDELFSDFPEMPWELEEKLLSHGIREDYAKSLAFDTQKLMIFRRLQETFKDQNIAELAKVVMNTSSFEDAEKVVHKKSEKKTSEAMPEEELLKIIKNVISNNQKAVEDYKNGTVNSIKFLMGQVMKQSKGQADPTLATSLLESMLA